MQILSDSCLKEIDIKRLYAMDSTIITLFKDMKGCGRLPKEGKKKGGIKATQHYRENGKLVHRSRRIAYWDAESGRSTNYSTK